MPSMNIPEVTAYIDTIRDSGVRVEAAAKFIATDKMGLDALSADDPQVAGHLRTTGGALIQRYHRLGKEMATEGGRIGDTWNAVLTYRDRVVSVTNSGTRDVVQFSDQQAATAADGNPMLVRRPA